jgi:hypothetical protein
MNQQKHNEYHDEVESDRHGPVDPEHHRQLGEYGQHRPGGQLSCLECWEYQNQA